MQPFAQEKRAKMCKTMVKDGKAVTEARKSLRMQFWHEFCINKRDRINVMNLRKIRGSL